MSIGFIWVLTSKDLNSEMGLKLSTPNSNISRMWFEKSLPNTKLSEYSIPLQDFVDQGLDLSQIFIPFAIWNPTNSDGNWQGGEVLVDNIYFD